MLPDGAHLRSEDWTVFFLNQTIPDLEKIQTDEKQKKNKPQLLYVLNLVRTKHDTSVRRSDKSFFEELIILTLVFSPINITEIYCRGAMVKAMAICTKHQFLHIYKVRHSNVDSICITKVLSPIVYKHSPPILIPSGFLFHIIAYIFPPRFATSVASSFISS